MKTQAPTELMKKYADQNGITLFAKTQKQKTLVVFLRHFGCTFCREALDDIADQRAEIENSGTAIALVHMVHAKEAEAYLDKKGLTEISHFSDPNKELYEAFRLERGQLAQLFGPKSIVRGFQAGVLKGHGIGKLAGDGFQMPGVFLISGDEILNSFKHDSAADRPNYIQLSKAAPEEAASLHR